MSIFKILIVSAAGVVAAGVVTVLTVGYLNSPSRLEADKPATPAPTTTPALSPAEVKVAYGDCTQRKPPSIADAAQRAAACSRALQSHQLQPQEVAMARFMRGVARTMLGDKVLASEDYLDAIQRYDQLISSTNPDALNLYRRAAALDAVGQTDKALTDYSEAIKLDPSASLAFLNRGVLLATRKRAYDRAIQDFDRVLVLEPDNVDALIRRGDAFTQLGDFGRGMSDLDRAVSLAPENALAYLMRGLAYGRRGNSLAALQNYDVALKHDPRNADALSNRAAIYLGEGKLDMAIRDLDLSISIDQSNPLAFYNRGYAHFAKKEYEKAIADYSSAIALNPQLGLAYNNRGLTRAIAGQDLVQALADCDTALKLMPINLDVRDTRGFIYLKLGDPALALNEYNAALDIDPNRALSLYGRGLARIKNGNQAGGEADQRAAETINPEVARQFSVYGLN
ncbi:tetratricopeptide repeat protein [Reyranella sp.]|uniref:tetratricopeptide repeat protein n=1 Tax=Reyranella sp. TaxID=1929291 RepID=UPI0012141ABB|nr:tetratricopeptide repeat protein [Reyranella sp.]TAJ83702.1 MAG: tetratricopeptide repeat protein [Reyranella sp.]